MTEKTVNAPKTVKKEDNRIAVGAKVDPELWDKCEVRAFNEARIRTNAGIIEAALTAYAEGK